MGTWPLDWRGQVKQPRRAADDPLSVALSDIAECDEQISRHYVQVVAHARCLHRCQGSRDAYRLLDMALDYRLKLMDKRAFAETVTEA